MASLPVATYSQAQAVPRAARARASAAPPSFGRALQVGRRCQGMQVRMTRRAASRFLKRKGMTQSDAGWEAAMNELMGLEV